MLSGKERAYLKGLANNIDPIFQIGKNGISENLINQLDDALEARELIKVNVLNNSFLESDDIARQLTKELDAEFVQSIGNKFVLYKESKGHKKIQLPKK